MISLYELYTCNINSLVVIAFTYTSFLRLIDSLVKVKEVLFAIVTNVTSHYYKRNILLLPRDFIQHMLSQVAHNYDVP